MTVPLNAGAIISAMNQITVVYFTKISGKSKIAKTGDWFGAITIETETFTASGSTIFTIVTKESIRTLTFSIFTFAFPATTGKGRDFSKLYKSMIAYPMWSHESVEQSNPMNPGLHSHVATP